MGLPFSLSCAPDDVPGLEGDLAVLLRSGGFDMAEGARDRSVEDALESTDGRRALTGIREAGGLAWYLVGIRFIEVGVG